MAAFGDNCQSHDMRKIGGDRIFSLEDRERYRGITERQHDTTQAEGIGVGEHLGKDPDRYSDIFLFVPGTVQIVHITEGTGDNLLPEDIENGYVDYIYYEQYGIGLGVPEVDGGQILLEEPLRERYRCMEDCIPDVLDMAYGSEKVDYTILK